MLQEMPRVKVQVGEMAEEFLLLCEEGRGIGGRRVWPLTISPPKRSAVLYLFRYRKSLRRTIQPSSDVLKDVLADYGALKRSARHFADRNAPF